MAIRIANTKPRFFALFVLIWLGFSHALFMNVGRRDATVLDAVLGLLREVQITYRMGALGDFDPDAYEEIWFIYILFLLCTATITIVFLNVHAFFTFLSRCPAISSGCTMRDR